jgi:predicted nucleic acid-binding protein
MTVDELCERHGRVAFDTNVFVYLFESAGPLADAATAVVNAVSARRIVGIVSTVALAEAIVGPAHLGDDTMGERYADAIRSIENLHVVPATVEIAAESGFVRAHTGLTLADSMHVATAQVAGASILITNDRRIHSLPKLDVIQLADLVV